ncbi:anaerobic ribonucleoside-triphosphate reductase [Patescibacteria group bacterium]|nr:anaerobic ribonucleoside-triphosphate reductase [Patescibacteria group bacterium]MBU1721664.1 anaerobic ribonucleoside-triphosphate reductase [Patescibacteria group bacterium]MBU1900973.1 anaerobic ribonucleoside-triphosphate reductase [Patescibacteria group bacterium]
MVAAPKESQRTRCEVWTRVMGYHRPVTFYNKGKKSEFCSRTFFQECSESNESFSEQYTA